MNTRKGKFTIRLSAASVVMTVVVLVVGTSNAFGWTYRFTNTEACNFDTNSVQSDLFFQNTEPADTANAMTIQVTALGKSTMLENKGGQKVIQPGELAFGTLELGNQISDAKGTFTMRWADGHGVPDVQEFTLHATGPCAPEVPAPQANISVDALTALPCDSFSTNVVLFNSGDADAIVDLTVNGLPTPTAVSAHSTTKVPVVADKQGNITVKVEFKGATLLDQKLLTSVCVKIVPPVILVREPVVEAPKDSPKETKVVIFKFTG